MNKERDEVQAGYKSLNADNLPQSMGGKGNNNEKNLTELISKMRKTDKGTVHSYIPIYESSFSKLRHEEVDVLEIGVQSGESIKLWHDYFTHGNIYGIYKILNKAAIKLCDHKRIKLYQANAYDLDFINKTFNAKGQKFDVIIDDGPHTKNSQIFCAQNYCHLLKEDGVLFIEDVHPSTVAASKIIDLLPKKFQARAEIFDLRKNKNRDDDILIKICG